jgi:hypothetical protein
MPWDEMVEIRPLHDEVAEKSEEIGTRAGPSPH